MEVLKEIKDGVWKGAGLSELGEKESGGIVCVPCLVIVCRARHPLTSQGTTVSALVALLLRGATPLQHHTPHLTDRTTDPHHSTTVLIPRRTPHSTTTAPHAPQPFPTSARPHVSHHNGNSATTQLTKAQGLFEGHNLCRTVAPGFMWEAAEGPIALESFL